MSQTQYVTREQMQREANVIYQTRDPKDVIRPKNHHEALEVARSHLRESMSAITPYALRVAFHQSAVFHLNLAKQLHRELILEVFHRHCRAKAHYQKIGNGRYRAVIAYVAYERERGRRLWLSGREIFWAAPNTYAQRQSAQRHAQKILRTFMCIGELPGIPFKFNKAFGRFV